MVFLIKVMIADDEPRIRRGIKNIINWEEFGLTIVGEAEDGEMALEVSKNLKPDIFLLDICMPFLNGLELITELNNNFDNPIIIIISGHDEFKYAQAAIQLNVFDYILKPIDREILKSTILKAKEEIVKREDKRQGEEFTTIQLKKSNLYLKENFMRDWVSGKLSNEDISNQMKYFNINYKNLMGMIIIRFLDKREAIIENKWQKDLLCYAVENIAKDLMDKFNNIIIFTDSKKQVVIISEVTLIKEWKELVINLENSIYEYLKIDVVVEREFLNYDPMDVNEIYKKLCNNLAEKSKKTPVVIEVQKYINRNYSNETVSITEIANKIGISQTYLTRLLKKELGMTFVDYLTSVRIKNSIILMEDPEIRIYEIAELVGYSTQHYFSNVFKKHMGMAPLDYKRGSNL